MFTDEWLRVSQCDPAVVSLYSRHYSSAKSGATVKKWLTYGIAGPGKVLTYVTPDYSALFVWIKHEYSLDGQTGVNCAVFRNEGEALSSQLILAAEKRAWEYWPGERLFTYVNPGAVKSKNPGYCFKVAGWRYCGVSAGGLVILEKEAVCLEG